MAATAIAVIQSTAIFRLDAHQCAQTCRRSTAWIKHFAEYLDQDVLRKLPGPFAAEYVNGNETEQMGGGNQSVWVNHTMLYDLTNHLQLLEGDADPPHNSIQILSPFSHHSFHPFLAAQVAALVCTALVQDTHTSVGL